VLLSASTPPPVRERLLDSGRWREGEQAGAFTRLVRVEPLRGRATWAAGGVRALTPVEVGPERQVYDVRVDAAAPQRVVLRDPWWPGYRATLDGVEVPTTPLDGTVVQVQLPPGGYTGRLVVDYRPAGLDTGIAVSALGLVVALAGVHLRVQGARV
jgi:hypothetical protein